MVGSGRTLLGSITKLQILNTSNLLALNGITAANTIKYTDIITGTSWETIELLPQASYKIKTAETTNGPLRSIEINCQIMTNDEYLLQVKMLQRYVLLITDGDGLRWLVGNKQEYLKLEFDTDSKAVRSQAKVNAISFKGAMTTAFLSVL